MARMPVVAPFGLAPVIGEILEVNRRISYRMVVGPRCVLGVTPILKMTPDPNTA